MTSRFSAPTTVDDAIAILAADPAARLVAGGTDLVVAARQGRKPLPEGIVAIDRIRELSGAGVNGDGALVLGALTSHAWLAADQAVRDGWSALSDAASIVGSPATRSTGTIGGNLMNASPAADTIAPLVVLGAVATLAGPDGARREVAVAQLATAPGRTSAAADELLLDVRVPAQRGDTGSAYIRLEYRQAMEIAVVGAAVAVTLGGSGGESGGRVASARVALTAVAPTIVASPAAAAALTGSAGDVDACRSAGAAAAADGQPIDDVRASAEYRRAMIEVVVARAALAAITRATGGIVPVPASRWAHGRAV